ncbi:MAG: hypothetical protein ACRC6M_08075, partial [Microcystaceae cyanobacterium]
MAMQFSWNFVFEPATRLMNRRSYPQKFVLLSGVFLLPLSLSLYLLLSEIQGQINFAQKEFRGLQYLKILQQFNRRVIQYSSLASVKELEQSWDSLVKTESDSLGDNSTKVALQTLEQDWRYWQQSVLKSKDFSPFVALRPGIQKLRQQVGDRSNLILDPDLDSYYLMDAVLLTIPRIETNLAEIQEIMTLVNARKP